MIECRGFKPYSHQRAVIDLLRDSHGTGRVVSCVSSRQKGKSLMLCNLLLYFALNYSNTDNFAVSPTLKQSKKLYKEIKNGISTKIIKTSNSTDFVIEFINGSTIQLRSAEQGDALRGYTADFLAIDEAAYIDDEIFTTILPWVDVRKAPILMVSSPFKKNGFFYRYCKMGESGEYPNIMTVNWSDEKFKEDINKLLPEEKLNEYRRIIPPQQFRTEYLGLWLDSDATVFENFSKCIDAKGYNITKAKSIYCGIDWGNGTNGDYTAIVFLDENAREIALWYSKSGNPTQQVKTIAKMMLDYADKLKCITAEDNSMGAVYIDVLKSVMGDRYSNIITPFTTTNSSKCRIIGQLQSAFQNESIHLMDDKEQNIELGAYSMEFTPKNKNITFNAPNGLHDDIVMALAFAYEGYKTKSKRGQYSIRVV